MTISEIAKLAGVSSAAVSVLNDGSLSQEKRQRIERVIRETKYRPSEYARTMRTKRATGSVFWFHRSIQSRCRRYYQASQNVWIRRIITYC